MQNYLIQTPLKSSAWMQSYLAEDDINGRQIILKFIIHPTTRRIGWYGRFHDRLTTIQKLLERQPALPIAPIRAWGKLSEPYETPNQTIPADSPYFVLDYIEGYTLASLLEEQRQTPLPLAVEIVAQIAAILEPIHAAGLAHGNLKPSNILFAADDRLMLTDFHLMPGGGYLMNVGEQLSLDEAAYVSPEQTQTERAISPRSDIYNLGLIFFEMTTGQRPFRGQSVSRLLREHSFNPPPSVRRINNALPQEIDPILQKALAKNDLARYATANEMVAAARQLLADLALSDAPDDDAPDAGVSDFPMPVVVPVTSMAPDPLTTITLAPLEEEERAASETSALPPTPPPDPPSTSAEPAAPAATRKAQSESTLVTLIIASASLVLICAAIATILMKRDENYGREMAATPAAGVTAASSDETSGQLLSELLGGPLSEQLTAIEPIGPRALVELAQLGEGTINLAQLSPDGRTVAVIGEAGVKLYDGQTLEPLAQLTAAPGRAIAWLNEEQRLALPYRASGRGGVELRDLAAAQAGDQLTANTYSDIAQITIAPDDRQLAVLFNNGDIHIWDIARQAIVNQLNYGENRAILLAWSPQDERLAVVLDNRTTLIVNTADGRTIHTLEGSQFNPIDVAWSPDAAYLAAVTSSGRLIVWATEDGRFLHERRSVSAIGWTPDGRYLTGGDFEGYINFWATADIVAPDEANGEMSLSWQLHETAVAGLQWLADPPRLLSWSEEGWLRLYHGENGALLAEREGFSLSRYNAVSDLAWSPDGRYLAASSWDSALRVWDTETAAVSATLRGHTSYVNHAAWSPHGDWLATGALDSAGPLRLWRWESGESFPLRYESDTPVGALAFSPDGRWLAVGMREGLLVLQPIPPNQSGAGALSTHYHEYDITGLAWSPDGRYLLSGSNDGQIALWQMPQGTVAHSWQVEGGYFGLSLDWSPTAPLVATAVSFREIQLWNSQDWTLAQTLSGSTSNNVNQVAFSGDGRWLGVVGGRQVTIFDVETGEAAYDSGAHPAAVRTIVWSPTANNRLATGGDDGVVRLWLLPEGQPGR
jgi:WD40 repeat protein/serine/threonine protein kinase